jgi:hypothetical protein
LVYLALAEELVEKLAGIFFVLLNVGTFSISFAPCVGQHGVQQILLELPLLHLGELVEKNGRIRLGRSIKIRGVAEVGQKYDGIMSRSFSPVCRLPPPLDLCL